MPQREKDTLVVSVIEFVPFYAQSNQVTMLAIVPASAQDAIMKPDPLGQTTIDDLGKQDQAKIKSLALLELSSLFDIYNVVYTRRKAKRRLFKGRHCHHSHPVMFWMLACSPPLQPPPLQKKTKRLWFQAPHFTFIHPHLIRYHCTNLVRTWNLWHSIVLVSLFRTWNLQYSTVLAFLFRSWNLWRSTADSTRPWSKKASPFEGSTLLQRGNKIWCCRYARLHQLSKLLLSHTADSHCYNITLSSPSCSWWSICAGVELRRKVSWESLGQPLGLRLVGHGGCPLTFLGVSHEPSTCCH